MCGIAGWVGPAAPELLTVMLAALKHRGPDGEGAFVEPGLALGMTRLAVIDLVTGQQPIGSEDGELQVVLNGEIYNYRALRSDLEARGHRFRTRTDTEVVVHAFEEAGPACVERFRGMFAFALWDRRRRRLTLGRDRLGKKPLYYWRRGAALVFASEPKALLLHPDISRELDPPALAHYLAFGYTPATQSIFAGITKLPPGHLAVFEEGELRHHRYWALPPGPADRPGGPATFPEAAAAVRTAVREAVRLRLESDVPLGVFLSGGVDSGAVVAAMREVGASRVATFTIGFGSGAPAFDELGRARAVARRYGTEHHEEVIDPRVADILPAVVEHFDEPFADSSALPTFVVAQATARHVKVALSGIGGDEVFAGYPRHLAVGLSERWARLPRAVRTVVGGLARRLAGGAESGRDWSDRVRRFVVGGDRPLPERYIGWTRLFDDAELARLLTPAGRAAMAASDIEAAAREAFASHGHGDPRDGAFRIDLATYLPDDLLVMADRMGMAHGLEVRAPLCDHLLVETSLAIPPALKLRHGRSKALLKAAFADALPREVLAHPKQGFMIPLARWLRTDLAPLADDLLAPARVRARGLLEPRAVEALRREHASGARTHADRLWALMMLEAWMGRYLDTGARWSAR